MPSYKADGCIVKAPMGQHLENSVYQWIHVSNLGKLQAAKGEGWALSIICCVQDTVDGKTSCGISTPVKRHFDDHSKIFFLIS